MQGRKRESHEKGKMLSPREEKDISNTVRRKKTTVLSMPGNPKDLVL